MDDRTQEITEPQRQPGLPEGVPEDDPFPKIFIVCFAIFAVLGMVIFGVIAYDMTQRVERSVLQTAPGQEAPAPSEPGGF